MRYTFDGDQRVGKKASNKVFFVTGRTSESTESGDSAMRVKQSMLACAMFLAALIFFNFNALTAHTPDHHMDGQMPMTGMPMGGHGFGPLDSGDILVPQQASRHCAATWSPRKNFKYSLS